MFKLISSAVDLILGLLLAIGPWTLFKVCGTAEKVMKCHYSAQAVTVLGVVLILFGLIRLLLDNRKKLSSAANSIVVYAAAIAVPAFVIGGCANSAMHCQKVAFPCIYAICAVGIVVQLVAFLKARKDD
jgi:cytochrome bd-type quinol oxidase subunit 2